MISNLLDDFCGHSCHQRVGWNVLGDHGAGSHNAMGSDSNSRHYRCVGSYHDIVFNRPFIYALLMGDTPMFIGLVTDLGKVLDPCADVICHLTFFTCFIVSGIMPVWAFVFILWREFAQSFTRMLMMGKGKAMAANIFGKAKTCLYALTSVLGFGLRMFLVLSFDENFTSVFRTVLTVLFALAAFSSVASYLIYVRAIVKSKALSGMTR